MRTSFLTLAVVCMSAAGASSAAGQIGPFIDWINKMSGPELQTFGFTYRFPEYAPGRFLNIGYNPGQRVTLRHAEGIQNLAQGYFLYRTLSQQQPGAEQAQLGQMRAIFGDPQFGDCLGRVVERLTTDSAVWYRETYGDSMRDDLDELAQKTTALFAGQPVPEGRTVNQLLCSLLSAPDSVVRDPGWGVRLRVRPTGGYDRDNAERTGVDIHVLSLQFTGELMFGLGDRHRQFFGLESGIGVWYWFGDIGETVSTSVPILLNWHPFARCSSWLLRNFRLGAGVHVFSGIENEAFAEAGFTERIGGEVVPTFFVSLDISRSALKSAPRLEC